MDFSFQIADCKGKQLAVGTRSAYFGSNVEGRIATGGGPIIIPAPHRMKRIGSILLAGFFFLLAPGQLCAQSDDPSEIFLKAYMTSQQGEKLEHENQFKAALAKYRSAGSLIEELHKKHSDWQPAIVEYRGRKSSESILRVQYKAATQNDLAAASTPLPEATPPLRENAGPGKPSTEIVVQRPSAPPAQTPSDAAIKDATKKLHDKVDQLEAELQKSRSQLDTAEKEKRSLDGRLKDTSSKLGQAQSELEKSKGAEPEVSDQHAQAQESLKKLQAAGGNNAKEQEALRAEVARLRDTLTAAEEARFAAEKEKAQTSVKMAEAEKQIAGATRERDEALALLKGAKEPEKRVKILVAENSALKQKVEDAEKSVRELSEDKPKKEKELAEVKGQIEQLRQQMAARQKQNQDFEKNVADLRLQLVEAGAELEKAKLKGANAEETVRLTKENEILRGIVVRERGEGARGE